MQPDQKDIVQLSDMLTFAREVQQFIAGRTFQDFETDVFLRRAVQHSIQLIGEAAKRISREFEQAHPEIPWNRIIVQRHRIVHEYDRIDDGLIWSVAVKYVPALITAIEPLLPPPPQSPPEAPQS